MSCTRSESSLSPSLNYNQLLLPYGVENQVGDYYSTPPPQHPLHCLFLKHTASTLVRHLTTSHNNSSAWITSGQAGLPFVICWTAWMKYSISLAHLLLSRLWRLGSLHSGSWNSLLFASNASAVIVSSACNGLPDTLLMPLTLLLRVWGGCQVVSRLLCTQTGIYFTAP